jgi:hypothetical protein
MFPRWIHYEAVVDPAAGGGGIVDPAPAEETFQISQEDWQATQERLAQLADLEQQIPVAPGQQQQRPDDGFDDVREGLGLLGVDASRYDAYLDARIAQATAPLQQTQQFVTEQQYSELVADVAADVASRTGDFDRELAEMYASRFLDGEIQKAGGNVIRGLEVTMEKAAQMARDYEKKIREQSVAQYTNQLTTLAGVPGEPGSSYSQGVSQRVIPDFAKTRESVTARMFGDGFETS